MKPTFETKRTLTLSICVVRQSNTINMMVDGSMANMASMRLNLLVRFECSDESTRAFETPKIEPEKKTNGDDSSLMDLMASRSRINLKFRLGLSSFASFYADGRRDRFSFRSLVVLFPPLAFLYSVLFFSLFSPGSLRVSIVPPSDGELALFNYGNYGVYDRLRCVRRAQEMCNAPTLISAFIGQIAKSNCFRRKLLYAKLIRDDVLNLMVASKTF